MTVCPLCGHENPEGTAVCASCGYGGPEEPPPPPSFLARVPQHTRRFVAVFYTLAVLEGFSSAQLWETASFIFSIAAGLTVSWWVITDASDRGRPMRFFVRLLVILFGGLSALIYLIVSRRLRGLGWLLLNLIAYVTTVWLSFDIGLVLGEFARD